MKINRYNYHSVFHGIGSCNLCGATRHLYNMFDQINDGYEAVLLCKDCQVKHEDDLVETSYVPEVLDAETNREIVPWIHTEYAWGMPYVKYDTSLGRKFYP